MSIPMTNRIRAQLEHCANDVVLARRTPMDTANPDDADAFSLDCLVYPRLNTLSKSDLLKLCSRLDLPIHTHAKLVTFRKKIRQTLNDFTDALLPDVFTGWTLPEKWFKQMRTMQAKLLIDDRHAVLLRDHYGSAVYLAQRSQFWHHTDVLNVSAAFVTIGLLPPFELIEDAAQLMAKTGVPDPEIPADTFKWRLGWWALRYTCYAIKRTSVRRAFKRLAVWARHLKLERDQ